MHDEYIYYNYSDLFLNIYHVNGMRLLLLRIVAMRYKFEKKSLV